MNIPRKKDLISIIIPTMNRSDDVVFCLESILRSSDSNFEIIVVDNNSSDDTVEKIRSIYSENKNIKLVESKKNLGAGGGRNAGAKIAKGKYLLFVDSDNVIDEKMISRLVYFLEENKNCGMVGPLMLFKDNPNLIWIYSADINMWTSRAYYAGNLEKNARQYKEIEETGHIPNCFMVRKDDFKRVRGFDEKYLVMFEEADFAEKIKKLGKKIFIYAEAVTYHNVPVPKKEDLEKGFTFKSNQIAFLTSRNRVYFMRKNAKIINFLIFVSLFLPLSIIYYQFSLLRKREFSKARACLSGSLAGFFM